MEEQSTREHRSHHHHHHYHEDEATVFKNKNLEAKSRRNLFSNLLLVVLCILAVLISLAVIYVYSIN